MRISELEAFLRNIRENRGDLEVVVHHDCGVDDLEQDDFEVDALLCDRLVLVFVALT